MKLRAERISKCYSRGGREFHALQETDLVLEAGRLVTVSGRSGSGKTTLLNLLAGLAKPSSGSILAVFAQQEEAAKEIFSAALKEIPGQGGGYAADLCRMDDRMLSRFRNEYFGIIPQGLSAVVALTVLENVMLPATVYAGSEPVKDRALELLEQMGIADLLHAFPRELSGGELRRMAIARAMIRDPQILFADEPTSDLDDDNRDAVFSMLRTIADEGKAVMVVTHEHGAVQYADVRYRMDAGVLETAT